MRENILNNGFSQCHKENAYFFTWVSDANHEQLAEHICYNLHSSLTHNMAADQMNGGGEQARTGSSCLHPDFLMLAVQEVIGTVAHKLGEGMPWFKKDKHCEFIQ